MNTLIRIALYTSGALAGVYLVNVAKPVELDPTAALGAAGTGLDTALEQLAKGKFSGAWTALAGGAAAAGNKAHDQVQGQVRSTVVLGVVAGCAFAGLVDAFVL